MQTNCKLLIYSLVGLLLLGSGLSALGGDDPAKGTTPNRKGADGYGNENENSELGSGADQPLIQLPALTAEQLSAIERRLTAGQKKLIDENLELARKFAAKRGQSYDEAQTRRMWLTLAGEIEKLASDDVDVYLAARRVVLACGPASLSLVNAKLKMLPATAPVA